MVSAFLHGYGAPTYGPVPVYPKVNPYTDASEAHNLYPYSVSAAKALLSSHGWRIVHGVQTRESATACGKGVKNMSFTRCDLTRAFRSRVPQICYASRSVVFRDETQRGRDL